MLLSEEEKKRRRMEMNKKILKSLGKGKKNKNIDNWDIWIDEIENEKKEKAKIICIFSKKELK